jgi:hypothetical protein
MRRIGVFVFWLAAYCSGVRTTPLITAARDGDVNRVRSLIARGANPNVRAGVNNWTPLEHAVHKNQIASIAALLDAGADPNAASRDGMTPLIMAAGYGYTPIVKLLLQRGANPLLTDQNGRDALEAAMSGTGDVDRITLFDCQRRTVGLLRHDVPALASRSRTQLATWMKRCE